MVAIKENTCYGSSRFVTALINIILYSKNNVTNLSLYLSLSLSLSLDMTTFILQAIDKLVRINAGLGWTYDYNKRHEHNA